MDGFAFYNNNDLLYYKNNTLGKINSADGEVLWSKVITEKDSSIEADSAGWIESYVSDPVYYMTKTPLKTNTTYKVYLNDSAGNNMYSLDAKISASTESGTVLFSNIDSCYSSPKSFTLTTSQNVIIKVEPYSSSGYGNVAWKMIDASPITNYSIITVPTIKSICLDSLNSIYIAASATNKASAYSKKDIILKKFSSNGTEITSGWDKTIDYGHCNDEIPTELLFDGKDIIMIGTGYDSISGSSEYDGLFYKYSTNGTKLISFEIPYWQQSSSYHCDYVGTDRSGNYYFLGYSTYLIQYSSTGSQLWIKDHKISSQQAIIDSSNNIYAGGYGSNLISPESDQDWYLKKYSSSGEEL